MKDGKRSLIKMGTLRNKVIYFHEKIVFNFRKKIRNYLVANIIFQNPRLSREVLKERNLEEDFDKTRESIGGAVTRWADN